MSVYWAEFEWKELARVGVTRHLLVERKKSENNLTVILSTIKWKGGTESFSALLGKEPVPSSAGVWWVGRDWTHQQRGRDSQTSSPPLLEITGSRKVTF